MKRICNRCKELKHETEFERPTSNNCGSCFDEMKSIAFMEQYVQKKINQENAKNYTKNRMNSDPLFKLRIKISQRTRAALKAKKWLNSGNNEKLLGADCLTVRNHIESKFKEGMSWENRSLWHLDHIVPLSSATNEDQLYNLANYKNLSPEWKDVNLSKSAEIPKEIRRVDNEYEEASRLFNWYFFNADCSMDVAKKCAIHAIDLMLSNSFAHINFWERVKKAIMLIKTIDYSKRQ